LRYAGGGHPPAALFAGDTRETATLQQLESDGPAVGFGFDLEFESREVTLPAYARLYLFSDGAFEIQIAGGPMWTLEEYLEYLRQRQTGDGSPLDDVLAHCVELNGSPTLDDDCSILECDFE